MIIEWWKYINGYEGLYMVSTLGKVKSVDQYVKGRYGLRLVKGKILKPTLNKVTGYLYVDLRKDGVRKNIAIHRLVAEAFKPNPHNYPTVDHINRIRTDNRLENLRWSPWILQAENSSAKDVCSKSVLQYTKDMVFVAEYKSLHEASKKTGISAGHICNCCQGKRKSTGGYIWVYKEKGT